MEKSNIVFRPSALSRCGECVASIIPRGERKMETPYTALGRHIHELLHTYLIKHFGISGGSGHEISAQGLVAAFQSDFHGITRPTEEIYIYIEKLVAIILKRFAPSDVLAMCTEVNVVFKDSPYLCGTIDILLFSKTDLCVIDFKSGVVPVDAIRNPQLLAYAAYALHSKALRASLSHIQAVSLFVIQPNSYNANVATEYHTSKSEINLWLINTLYPMLTKTRELIEAEASLAKTPDDPKLVQKILSYYKVSGHCKLCNNLSSCYAISHEIEQIKVVAQEVNSNYDSALATKELFTEENILAILQLKDFLSVVWERCEEYLIEQYNSRAKLPRGVTAVAGRLGPLKFRDNNEAMRILAQKGLLEQKLPTPKQLLERGVLSHQEIEGLTTQAPYKPKFLYKKT